MTLQERKDKKIYSQKHQKNNIMSERTRTAWAVFKYCGTKTVPLRRKI
jgi:hypothetical protein